LKCETENLDDLNLGMGVKDPSHWCGYPLQVTVLCPFSALTSRLLQKIGKRSGFL